MVRNLVYAALSLAAASGAALSPAQAEQLLGSQLLGPQSLVTVGCTDRTHGRINVCPNEIEISCLGSSNIGEQSILNNNESLDHGHSTKRIERSARIVPDVQVSQGIVLTVCHSGRSDQDVHVEPGPYTHGTPPVIQ